MSSSRALFRLAPMLLLAFPAHAADVTVTLGAGNGFAIKNNTGAIERLRVDEATGNVSHNGALFVHTTGGLFSTFVGAASGNVSTTGERNSGFGNSALRNNTTGSFNSAFGQGALAYNTTGSNNSAVGEFALLSNTTGNANTAAGSNALRLNHTGSFNTAAGDSALFSNTTGCCNSAFGRLALNSNAGSNNSAFGQGALNANTTGNGNVAMGLNAGASQTTGSSNIYIANTGAAGESGQIRIGTVGTHTGTIVAGIHTAVSASGIAVLVNASGKLGTTTSSARFKQDVRDMAGASDVLLKLRPVVFHYREEAVGAEEAKTTQYGLIAEEVAAVAPDLVAPDADGKPYSVKYHELPALLLNELQEQQRKIEGQQQTINVLLTRVAELEQRSSAAVRVE